VSPDPPPTRDSRAPSGSASRSSRASARGSDGEDSHGADTDDRGLARRVGMSANTFWQNIARARKQLADCLRGKGVPLEEILS